MLTAQVVVIAAEDYLDLVWDFMKANPGLWLVFPPSLAFSALESALVGNVIVPLAVTGVLVLYAALLYRAHRRRVLAQFRGEDLGEGVVVTAAQAAPIEAGWHLPVLPARIAALVERPAFKRVS